MPSMILVFGSLHCVRYAATASIPWGRVDHFGSAQCPTPFGTISCDENSLDNEYKIGKPQEFRNEVVVFSFLVNLWPCCHDV